MDILITLFLGLFFQLFVAFVVLAILGFALRLAGTPVKLFFRAIFNLV